jgi:hypothetical protein
LSRSPCSNEKRSGPAPACSSQRRRRCSRAAPSGHQQASASAACLDGTGAYRHCVRACQTSIRRVVADTSGFSLCLDAFRLRPSLGLPPVIIGRAGEVDLEISENRDRQPSADAAACQLRLQDRRQAARTPTGRGSTVVSCCR